MIKSVTAINSNNEKLKMTLSTPEESGVLITNIDGLNPPKSDISMTNSPVIDGSFFNFARANNRNIVMDLRYIDSQMSIEEVRHLVYKIFKVKDLIRLIIETDSKVVATKGYVESNDVEIFSQTEGSQVSILCESAWLTSWSEQDEYIIDYFSGIENLFEFPFENNSLTEDLIEFSSRYNIDRKNIEYYGEISTGFIGECRIVGEVVGLTIYNVTSREVFTIEDDKVVEMIGTHFQSGDIITINTIVGQKSVRLQRGVQVYNLLPALNSNSKWVQLNRGVNDIWLLSESGIDNVEFTMKYQLLYQGA